MKFLSVNKTLSKKEKVAAFDRIVDKWDLIYKKRAAA